MVQVIPASEMTLEEVESKFNLQQSKAEQFFREWQENLPELSEEEKQSLDQVKADFLYLNKYPLFEEAVKMVVLSPLLTQAGFYRKPFRLTEEVPVQIAMEEEGQMVRGRIDVLIIQERFWVLVVESKQASFSLKNAIVQALVYMAATPNPEGPVWGLVTNGSHFIFLKLMLGGTPQYALSDEFSLLRRGNDLYGVLRVLKQIGNLMARE